ncbi:MAG: hypothetical protein IKN59_02465 [Paludibacteraceae bacterium]|nr:hypothetical protein [Paludibacteraceae bacterium]
MKKLFISCAVVLAAGLFASCGDTNYCYDVTMSVGSLSYTYPFWGTSNELKAYEQQLKETQKSMGIDENTIQISHKINGKSQADCK